MRLLFKILKQKMDKNPSDGMMLYVFYLPLRAIAKTTGGMITENMARDLCDLANGGGIGSMIRFIRHNFADKKKIKAYGGKLEK